MPIDAETEQSGGKKKNMVSSMYDTKRGSGSQQSSASERSGKDIKKGKKASKLYWNLPAQV